MNKNENNVKIDYSLDYKKSNQIKDISEIEIKEFKMKLIYYNGFKV